VYFIVITTIIIIVTIRRSGGVLRSVRRMTERFALTIVKSRLFFARQKTTHDRE